MFSPSSHSSVVGSGIGSGIGRPSRLVVQGVELDLGVGNGAALVRRGSGVADVVATPPDLLNSANHSAYSESSIAYKLPLRLIQARGIETYPSLAIAPGPIVQLAPR